VPQISRPRNIGSDLWGYPIMHPMLKGHVSGRLAEKRRFYNEIKIVVNVGTGLIRP
jgi:hypothetical protein